MYMHFTIIDSSPSDVYILRGKLVHKHLGAEVAQGAVYEFPAGNACTTWAGNLPQGGLPDGVVYISGVLNVWGDNYQHHGSVRKMR